jgi:hypothetical protein
MNVTSRGTLLILLFVASATAFSCYRKAHLGGADASAFTPVAEQADTAVARREGALPHNPAPASNVVSATRIPHAAEPEPKTPSPTVGDGLHAEDASGAGRQLTQLHDLQNPVASSGEADATTRGGPSIESRSPAAISSSEADMAESSANPAGVARRAGD